MIGSYARSRFRSGRTRCAHELRGKAATIRSYVVKLTIPPNKNKGPKDPLSSEPREEQVCQEEGSLGDGPATIRNFWAILLGIAYGGSLLQGIEVGLQFVLKAEDTYVLGTLPTLEQAVIIGCGILAGLLGGYVSHSVAIGFGSAVFWGYHGLELH